MKYIYVRTNIINGKQYVGQTKNINTRNNFWNCLNCIYANKYISEDRKKYGLENWKTEILKECDDSESDFWERYYIKKLNTKYPKGYNISGGGIGGIYGCKHSDKTKKKMSEWRKKNQFGDKNPNYGKHWNEKQREAVLKAICKKVKEIREDGTEIIHASAAEAARQYGFDYSSISKAAKGKYSNKGHLYKNSNWYLYE